MQETQGHITRWKTHVTQLNTMLAPGNHMTMLSMPNVKTFIDELWLKQG
ncbi:MULTISPECIES: hypothetical protein [Xenorhabdus]|nr:MULTISPECIES: hypothetical protein [Xenorhabdus]